MTKELLDRIDAERAGRDLVSGPGMLPDRDRALVELVDLAGLRPKEAAGPVRAGARRRRGALAALPSLAGRGERE